jgi:hypothetical protein
MFVLSFEVLNDVDKGRTLYYWGESKWTSKLSEALTYADTDIILNVITTSAEFHSMKRDDGSETILGQAFRLLDFNTHSIDFQVSGLTIHLEAMRQVFRPPAVLDCRASALLKLAAAGLTDQERQALKLPIS